MAEDVLPSHQSALRDRSVLVTGHTGFKGSWLALWLHRLGARVAGLAQPAASGGAFEAMRVGDLLTHHVADIRNAEAVRRVVEATRPEVVFHLAAQPIVAVGYLDPVGTFATNVQGTLHVLEAIRAVGSVRAVVVVTSDKVYRQDVARPLTESDRLGHTDPYSSSKACAELAVSAWRASYGDESPPVATARAGNVIGGGDLGQGRLLPDVLHHLTRGDPAPLRNPHGVRPWQHVLDVLDAYLRLSVHLLTAPRPVDTVNVGPPPEGHWAVQQVVETTIRYWGAGTWEAVGSGLKETGALRLDATRAGAVLGWRQQLPVDDALRWTVDWHRALVEGLDVRAVAATQLDRYERRRRPQQPAGRQVPKVGEG